MATKVASKTAIKTASKNPVAVTKVQARRVEAQKKPVTASKITGGKAQTRSASRSK